VRRILSANAIKWIAAAAMLLDHGATVLLGRYLIAQGISYMDPYVLGTPYLIFLLCRRIGRLAFPLYGFLLLEGFLHTSSRKRYAFRMGLMALISEIPYDLVYYDTVLGFEGQNIFFTLLIGLLVMIGADAAKKQFGERDWKYYVSFAVCLALGMTAAHFGKTDFLVPGVLMLGLMYFLCGFWTNTSALLGGAAALAAASLTPSQFVGCFAVIPVYFYNGKRGRGNTRIFYAFYPAHLLILYALIKILPFG